jgi:hypothetical protein
VAGLQTVLRLLGVEAGLEEWSINGRLLRRPLESGPAARKEFLLYAVQIADLRAAAKRKGQEDIMKVDVDLARSLLQDLPAGGPREALRSVFVGDCIVRAVTKHWQGHDGRCSCGLALETKGHIFWECPVTAVKRIQGTGSKDFQLRAPQGVERELGLPLCDPRVVGWRADWIPPPQPQQERWTAQHLFVDASARHPRLRSIRTVGWAVVDGQGHATGGVLPPGTSVAWGETWALIESYAHCEERTIIWSDCQGATRLWQRCLKAGASRYAGALQALVPELRRARERLPLVQVVWIPSHLSGESFAATGYPEQVRLGNEAADREAKRWGACGLAPRALVSCVQQARDRARGVAEVVAEVQLSRLKQRLRTNAGQAVKSRKRKAPAGLQRLRAPGAKRVCTRRPENRHMNLKDLLMPSARAGISAAAAGELLVAAEPAGGFHDLWPVGPWPAPGTRAAANGRLRWPWTCRRCNATASDSSRAVVLARALCGQPEWTARQSLHQVVQLGADVYECRRCGRKGDAAHRSGLVQAMCPVPAVFRGELEWVEGSETLSHLLGRVSAFRRWAEPDPELRDRAALGGLTPVPPAEPPVVQGAVGTRLAGYREHCVCICSRKALCCACYLVAPSGQGETFRYAACSGVRPAEAAPFSLVNAVRRGDVRPVSAGSAERLALLGRSFGGGRLRGGAASRAGAGRSPAPGGFRDSAIGQALLAVVPQAVPSPPG